MIDRIRGFLDSAFESAPQTAKVQELKEELFANLVDKYNDQLRQGRAPEEAYQIVIGGIGDLDELIAQCAGTGAGGGCAPEEPPGGAHRHRP